MTIVHSNTEPDIIYLDRLGTEQEKRKGWARLLVRWDIRSEIISDPMTDETRIAYAYQEQVIWWYFERKLTGRVEIEEYLKSVEGRILEQAMASETAL